MTSFFMYVAADRTLRTADLTLLLIPFVYVIHYRIAYCDVTVSLKLSRHEFGSRGESDFDFSDAAIPTEA